MIILCIVSSKIRPTGVGLTLPIDLEIACAQLRDLIFDDQNLYYGDDEDEDDDLCDDDDDDNLDHGCIRRLLSHSVSVVDRSQCTSYPRSSCN